MLALSALDGAALGFFRFPFAAVEIVAAARSVVGAKRGYRRKGAQRTSRFYSTGPLAALRRCSVASACGSGLARW